MTKKNFIALADIIREHNTHDEARTHFTDGQILTLAIFCGRQNPAFDQEKWMEYVYRKADAK